MKKNLRGKIRIRPYPTKEGGSQTPLRCCKGSGNWHMLCWDTTLRRGVWLMLTVI